MGESVKFYNRERLLEFISESRFDPYRAEIGSDIDESPVFCRWIGGLSEVEAAWDRDPRRQPGAL